MHSKNLKLLILILTGLILAACAKPAPLQLPPPIVSDSPDSGWRNY